MMKRSIVVLTIIAAVVVGAIAAYQLLVGHLSLRMALTFSTQVYN